MSSLPAPSPRGPAVRALRSVLVGLGVAVCAASAHLAGGGQVGPAPVVGVAVAATAVAALLTGRRLTTGQLVGLLALGQVALHVLASAPTSHDRTMLVAHVVATGVSLLALRRAEDLWWQVADAVSAAWRPVQVVAVPAAVQRVVAVTTDRRGLRAARVVQGRAPPRVA